MGLDDSDVENAADPHLRHHRKKVHGFTRRLGKEHAVNSSVLQM